MEVRVSVVGRGKGEVGHRCGKERGECKEEGGRWANRGDLGGGVVGAGGGVWARYRRVRGGLEKG